MNHSYFEAVRKAFFEQPIVDISLRIWFWVILSSSLIGYVSSAWWRFLDGAGDKNEIPFIARMSMLEKNALYSAVSAIVCGIIVFFSTNAWLFNLAVWTLTTFLFCYIGSISPSIYKKMRR